MKELVAIFCKNLEPIFCYLVFLDINLLQVGKLLSIFTQSNETLISDIFVIDIDGYDIGLAKTIDNEGNQLIIVEISDSLLQCEHLLILCLMEIFYKLN